MASTIKRTFREECGFVYQIDKTSYHIDKGFVPNMRVPGRFYVNDQLKELMFDELAFHCSKGGDGVFLPAMKQIANVAALPGIVKASIGLPDVHAGYGFAIGNVAAFDMGDPESVVSPGGVGFDINCGVRLVRTNLTEKDIAPLKEALAQSVFDHIPVGVGSQGIIPTSSKMLEEALEMGMDWSVREGYAWAEDKEHCFAPETPVLLADGRQRAIGDCAVGDTLVDDLGRVRTVVRTKRGTGPLFEVMYGNDTKTVNTSRFVCNGGHQLVVFFGDGGLFSPVTANGDASSEADAEAYSVKYHSILHDNVLGFDAPFTETIKFSWDPRVLECEEPGRVMYCNTKEEARVKAEAVAANIPARLLWQPTVSQYNAFTAAYPSRVQYCHMQRVAPAVLPQTSPFPLFSEQLDLAYNDAEAAGGIHIHPDSRVSTADAAYLCGLWYGNGVKDHAVIHIEKPKPGGRSPLDTIKRDAPKLGLEVQALELDSQTLSDALSLCVYLSIASGTKLNGISTDPLLSNVFVCLLKRLDSFGSGVDKPVSEAAELAFVRDSEDVRAALLAGLIDSNGTRSASSWRFAQRGANNNSAQYLPIAQLMWRTALSIGYRAHLSAASNADPPIVHITAPVNGDIVSSRIMHEHKRVPTSVENNAAEKRLSRGSSMYCFSISSAGVGEYVSLEVDGPDHRFLLGDYLVAHNCEEYGRMLQANPAKVSGRAKKRGLPQLGTLGAGNHYAEIQVVDEIYDKAVAAKMGIDRKNQVCIMIHSGSRGLGHQVATDALTAMERAMARDGILTNDRQLACARIDSQEGQDYLAGMAGAANYAWVNRSSMTFLVRQAFAKTFGQSPDDLDMHVIYDVSHNIAKVEEHMVDGKIKRLLVHRKGATRAFPPHHPLIPVDYQFTGQPVLIGGTMGTCSYVLTGTEKGMEETFGSTCHGAGRALSRNKSRNALDYKDVLDNLESRGISIRVASPKLVMEEAPESYKDVTQVVQTCHDAGISKMAVKLRPIAVIKG